jgi:molecular chaperone GrpE
VTEAKKSKVSLSKGPEDFLDDLLDIEASEEEALMAEEAALEAEERAAEAEQAEAEVEVPLEDQLREQIAELQDRLMRTLADAENQRKRAIRDRQDAEERGGRRLARDMLPVFDNMKRALDAIDEEQREGSKALIEGIELTQREMVSAFKKNNIVPIDPQIGDKFDPQLHEALFEAPVPTVKKGHIIQVLGEGFTIAGSLVRPAQVGVSSGG